ncbi:protein FAR1-RELATED SEQUENCE 9-like [Phragmites australis]|uniref:protein FAR1-RELATED SEQUENCE 9-like n=1 Tax=Phragmites australis TaxID=29695 RepID=UPI002D79B249|nr:protein FAR1-RELATED SEQUENCE 9-like [Phragmites australis]
MSARTLPIRKQIYTQEAHVGSPSVVRAREKPHPTRFLSVPGPIPVFHPSRLFQPRTPPPCSKRKKEKFFQIAIAAQEEAEILPDHHCSVEQQVDPVDQQDASSFSEVRLSHEETHLEEIQQVVHNTKFAGGQSGTEGLFSEAIEAEVWSTPQGPHNGITFSTLLEAKEYYNSYAKRIGFSIRTNTSCRSAFTKEAEKLGCAFLRDEKTPSFVWLFQTFLEAMKGKALLNIITDQDAAMRSAIEHVFPLANHRNCRWHIMNKAAGTVGPLLKEDKELEDEFKDCINYSIMSEEFEAKWQAMIQKHGLQDNKHFKYLYSIRQSFVPVYYMHCFFPFFQSMQRSEGFNTMLKLYVSPNLSILDFIKQYQKIQDKCLVAQDGQDFRIDDKTRNTWSKNPIEKHASTVYMKNIFYRFSKEFEKIEEYFVQHIGDYQFRHVPNDKFVDGYGTRSYDVTAIEEEESYYCECSKFDRDGIICYHIIKVMSRFGVKKLPDRYIMERWKQQEMTIGANANANLQANVGTSGMPLQNQKTIRFSNLASTLTKFAREGSNSEDAYEIVTKHIGMMRSELEDLTKKKKKRTRCNEISANTAADALNNPSTPHATNAHITAASAPLTTATLVVASIAAMSSPTGLGTIGTNLQDASILKFKKSKESSNISCQREKKVKKAI